MGFGVWGLGFEVWRREGWWGVEKGSGRKVRNIERGAASESEMLFLWTRVKESCREGEIKREMQRKRETECVSV